MIFWNTPEGGGINCKFRVCETLCYKHVERFTGEKFFGFSQIVNLSGLSRVKRNLTIKNLFENS